MSIARLMQMAASGQGGEPDPFFNQTTLLLHGDGTNGAQNNTFLDSSTNNFTITRNGNTTQGTFSPFSLPNGEWSNYFDGASNINFADSADFTFDADFTIECWFFCPILPTTNHIIFSKWDAGAQEFIFEYGVRSGSNARQVRFFWGPHSTGSAFLSSASDAFNIGEWVHVAVTRSGSDCRLFINGTVAATGTNGTAGADGGSALYLGRYSGGGVDYLTGYLSNASILKGTAKYTAAFTPSTTPLSPSATNQKLLTCYSNRFVDANTATTAKAVTVGSATVQPFSPFAPSAAYSASVNGGSGYFDGSGDYLQVTDSTAFDFGTGDLTIEGWFYFNTVNADGVATVFFSTNTLGVLQIATENNVINVGRNSSSNIISASYTSSLLLNTWTHIAVERTSGVFKLFVNGSEIGSASNTDSFDLSSIYLGRQATGSHQFNGYMSNFRIVKGTAITPPAGGPTSLVTAVSGTELLCNFTNAGIFDNTGKNNLETVGNAQIDTTVKKYGTGSMEFDGTGDYLFIPPSTANNLLSLGTGDFTVETWVNFTSTAGDPCICSGYADASNGWYLQYYSGEIEFALGSSAIIERAVTLSTGTWYHIAVSRASGSLRLFLDGTQLGATVTGNTSNFNVTNGFYLAILNSTFAPSTRTLNGFIDDLRITKGVARYTTTFTPPTAAFPNL